MLVTVMNSVSSKGISRHLLSSVSSSLSSIRCKTSWYFCPSFSSIWIVRNNLTTLKMLTTLKTKIVAILAIVIKMFWCRYKRWKKTYHVSLSLLSCSELQRFEGNRSFHQPSSWRENVWQYCPLIGKFVSSGMNTDWLNRIDFWTTPSYLFIMIKQ